MQVKEALTPTGTNIWQIYTMDVRQRTVLGGVANENFIKAEVKKVLAGKNDKGYVFDLMVLRRQQSNTEGIRGMQDDLAFLQKELTIQTDFNGKPIRILNLRPIKDKWENHRKEFQKKYKGHEGLSEAISGTDRLVTDNEAFTTNFIESEIGTLFFPPIYNKLSEEGENCIQHKEFTDFLGGVSLPLKLTTTLKKRNTINHKAQLLRRGALNSDEFDHYTARKFFRNLTDNMKLAARVSADYMETYDLDKYHGITHAGQMLGVRVEALFSFEQIVRVTPQKKGT